MHKLYTFWQPIVNQRNKIVAHLSTKYPFIIIIIV